MIHSNFKKRVRFYFGSGAVVALLFSAALGVGWCDEQPAQETQEAVETTAVTLAASSNAGSAAIESLPASLAPWGVIGEYYWGIARRGSERDRYNDGYWAASGPAYPSYAGIQWNGPGDRQFRLTMGLGDLYTGEEAPYNEPMEAYLQTPLRSGSLTLGKFFVPFALQEWEYETKYGMMYQRSASKWDHTFALTYNTENRRPNFYTRHGFNLREGTGVGVSAAIGKGWTYNTSHRWALGADLSTAFGPWEVISEYIRGDGHYGVFEFAFVKLSFTGGKKLIPYVGLFHWSDRADELSHFRSAIAGVNYQLTPFLDLEGGYGGTSEKGKWWLQAHWKIGQ